MPERIRDLAPKAQIISLGGATEASIWSIAFPIDKVDPAWRSIPYGRPLTNQTFFVLNADLSPCPVWVPGQLFTGGLGVADGYLGDAEKTARSFVRHPRTGDRLYATGDWGRYLPDGNIEFLGRQDLQVKIGGHRIELGDIETILVQHPAVRDAVVIAQGERTGSKRLKAYVVASAAAAWGRQDLRVRMRLPVAMDDRTDVSFLPGQDPSALEHVFVQSERAFIQNLKDFLGAKLPEYMVPSSIVLIDSLPLTANGKVDRDALPSLEAARDKLAPSEPFVGPNTDTEKRIARVWAQLLGVERISVHERFSELGGDSLLAIQMIGKLAHEGLEVSPPDAFRHDTIAKLSKVVRPTKDVSSVAQLVGDVALTPVQHYFLERSEDQHRTVVHFLEAEGPLSVASLRAAVADLCQHHDALRSRFFLADDNWCQDIADTPPDMFEVIDVANSAEEERPKTIARVAQALHERLDIEHGPVLRVAYLWFGPQRPSSVLIAGSYVALDNVSWRLLFADLVKAYQQRTCGEDVALPASRTTLRRVTEHLRGKAAALSTRDCRLWVEMADHNVEPLPIDFDRGPNVIWAQDSVRESLERRTTDRLLHAFLGRHELGINDVLLAALAEAVCAWSGQRELLVELQGHGREVQLYENLDVSRIVGRLSTNYPVLLELSAAEGIDRVHAVRKQLARIPRGGTDYGLLRYLSGDAGLRAQAGKIRRADISFNYVGQVDAPAQLAEEPKIFYKGTGDIYSPEAARRYRLVLQGMVLAGQLHFDWLYSTHHHKRATVQALASRHLETVRAYVESL